MHKVLIISLVSFLIFSCKKDKKNTAIASNVAIEFNIENWPKKINVNPKVAVLIKDWVEYQEFETSFAGIYRIENIEDLSLIIEDLIEKQKAVEESNYPDEFNKPHIKSRQGVLKTYILKTKGNIEYRLDVQDSVKEMIDAFNALRKEFNVILNSKIDIDLDDGQKK